MSDYYFSALVLSIAFVPLTWAMYFSSGILKVPDITTDGSFTLGAVITALLMNLNVNPWLIVLIVIPAGAAAGSLTALLHSKFEIPLLLAGILVMTSLYSINLLLMGKSNLPFLSLEEWFNKSEKLSYFNDVMFLLFTVGFLALLLIVFLKTDLGLTLRAAGMNPELMKTLGYSLSGIQLLGLAMANTLTALSGSLVAMIFGFADISMGIGIVLSGLAGLMIGESILPARYGQNTNWLVFIAVAGTFIYRFILAWVISFGINQVYLKLVTALLVIVFISLKSINKPKANA